MNGYLLARQAGNERTTNVVILGALSTLLDIPAQTWLEAVNDHVPAKAMEVNDRAFMLGRENAL